MRKLAIAVVLTTAFVGVAISSLASQEPARKSGAGSVHEERPIAAWPFQEDDTLGKCKAECEKKFNQCTGGGPATAQCLDARTKCINACK
jgi:hypothetical protein